LAIDDLKSLRMPVRFRDAAFAFVFEKFIHRREENAGAARVDPDIEIKFVLHEVHVAVADHAEKFSRHFEIVGVKYAISDDETGVRLVRQAVTRPGNDRGNQTGEWTENRNGEDVAL